MDMASTIYYFKFQNREECYEICKSVGYCFTDPVTGDTVMDVPGNGHIDIAGKFYDPNVQPLSPSPEGEMEPDYDNYIWKEGFHLNVVIKDGSSIHENLLPYQISVATPNLQSR